MKKIILSAAILITSLAGISQIKEGSITYNVSMEGLPPEQAAMMDGTEQITFFKGDKSRVEFSSAFVSSIAISDGVKTTILMDQMGQKMYFEMTFATRASLRPTDTMNRALDELSIES